jgi:hypothetical protein
MEWTPTVIRKSLAHSPEKRDEMKKVEDALVESVENLRQPLTWT